MNELINYLFILLYVFTYGSFAVLLYVLFTPKKWFPNTLANYFVAYLLKYLGISKQDLQKEEDFHSDSMKAFRQSIKNKFQWFLVSSMGYSLLLIICFVIIVETSNNLFVEITSAAAITIYALNQMGAVVTDYSINKLIDISSEENIHKIYEVI